MSTWRCTCLTSNRVSAKFCEACGAERPVNAVEPAVSAAAPVCGAPTQGYPCPLPPTVWLAGHRGRCAWHGLVEQHGDRIQTPEEFERWCAMLALRYCTPFTHYSAVALWNFLTGLRSELPGASACAIPGCSIAPARATDEQVAEFRAQHRHGLVVIPGGKYRSPVLTPTPDGAA